MLGLTAAEVSRQFDIPAPRIRKWISRGKVRRLPDGGVDLDSLIRWVDRHLDTDAYWLVDSSG
jgi:hypothetical protein